ncbi:MAG: hypothetical protein JXB10_02535 [Pirellulales bacterium]|nr:hypothetical protein [Pirellulales bacterium]
MSQKTWFIVILSVMALLMVGIPAAQAVMINFNDLPGSTDQIPNGYGGLSWSSGFYYINAGPYLIHSSGSGAEFTPTNNMGVNYFGNSVSFSSDTNFTLNSAYFAAMGDEDLEITAKGYNGDSLVQQTTFYVDGAGTTLTAFNWSGIDSVTFSSSVVFPENGLADCHNRRFLMDDLSIDPATQQQVLPEPASVLIWGLMVFGVAACLRRGR